MKMLLYIPPFKVLREEELTSLVLLYWLMGLHMDDKNVEKKKVAFIARDSTMMGRTPLGDFRGPNSEAP